MGYYLRVFCNSDTVPSVASLEGALQAVGPGLRLHTDGRVDSADWENAELRYKDGKEPILVEINRNNGADTIAAEEAGEFASEIRALQQSNATARVLEHLRANRYTVCCRLLTDIDDDGFVANDQLMDYFILNHRGMVQADGEGFYDGDELLVELK
jgi:hypothetical protein